MTSPRPQHPLGLRLDTRQGRHTFKLDQSLMLYAPGRITSLRERYEVLHHLRGHLQSSYLRNADDGTQITAGDPQFYIHLHMHMSIWVQEHTLTSHPRRLVLRIHRAWASGRPRLPRWGLGESCCRKSGWVALTTPQITSPLKPAMGPWPVPLATTLIHAHARPAAE